jgi:hypothetical protein
MILHNQRSFPTIANASGKMEHAQTSIRALTESEQHCWHVLCRDCRAGASPAEPHEWQAARLPYKDSSGSLS